MRTEDFLRQVTALPGLSGNEGEVARFIAEAFGIVVKPTYDASGAVADLMFQL